MKNFCKYIILQEGCMIIQRKKGYFHRISGILQSAIMGVSMKYKEIRLDGPDKRKTEK